MIKTTMNRCYMTGEEVLVALLDVCVTIRGNYIIKVDSDVDVEDYLGTLVRLIDNKEYYVILAGYKLAKIDLYDDIALVNYISDNPDVVKNFTSLKLLKAFASI